MFNFVLVERGGCISSFVGIEAFDYRLSGSKILGVITCI